MLCFSSHQRPQDLLIILLALVARIASSLKKGVFSGDSLACVNQARFAACLCGKTGWAMPVAIARGGPGSTSIA